MKPILPKRSELKVEIYRAPQTWFGKVVTAILLVFSLWITVMFFAIFLMIIALVFAVLIFRLVLTLNKSEKGLAHSFKFNRVGYKNTGNRNRTENE